MTGEHLPVMLAEVLMHLAIKPDGIYVDATFGRGGHARAILQALGPKGRLLAIDKDPAAITAARQDPIFQDARFAIEQGSFTELTAFAARHGMVGQIDGILLDLGVSSPQLDDPQRGFSFLREGPLDMRMNPQQGISAADWLNTADQEDIALVLKEYGEERFAKRIAGAIVQQRQEQAITTTTRLAEIVAKANPRWERHKNPATRSFQAIRIYINQELEELPLVLEQSLDALKVGGRLAVISFHSLEDRIVKRFMQKQIKGDELPPEIPITFALTQPRALRVTPPCKPNSAELVANPRARSAILRVVEKVQ